MRGQGRGGGGWLLGETLGEAAADCGSSDGVRARGGYAGSEGDFGEERQAREGRRQGLVSGRVYWRLRAVRFF